MSQLHLPFPSVSKARTTHLPLPGEHTLWNSESRRVPKSQGLERLLNLFQAGAPASPGDGCGDLVSSQGMLNTTHGRAVRDIVKSSLNFPAPEPLIFQATLGSWEQGLAHHGCVSAVSPEPGILCDVSIQGLFHVSLGCKELESAALRGPSTGA